MMRLIPAYDCNPELELVPHTLVTRRGCQNCQDSILGDSGRLFLELYKRKSPSVAMQDQGDCQSYRNTQSEEQPEPGAADHDRRRAGHNEDQRGHPPVYADGVYRDPATPHIAVQK